MENDYTTKIGEAFGNPLLKVYLRDQGQISEVAQLLNGLSSVKKANATKSQNGSEKDTLTVYPVPTSNIDEMEEKVKQALNEHFA